MLHYYFSCSKPPHRETVRAQVGSSDPLGAAGTGALVLVIAAQDRTCGTGNGCVSVAVGASSAAIVVTVFAMALTLWEVRCRGKPERFAHSEPYRFFAAQQSPA
jgi:hypothetical protein